MSKWVNHFAEAIAPEHICNWHAFLATGGQCLLVHRIDIVHVDVDPDRGRSEPLGILVVAAWLADEDAFRAEPKLAVPHPTLRRM